MRQDDDAGFANVKPASGAKLLLVRKFMMLKGPL
jgi:hypothetical protein